jgi:tRNA U34 5-carboxymethylaminomethyl modifying enzyme MnmG/GidA
VLPRLVLRMRRAVRRLQRNGENLDLIGAANSARWKAMLSEIDERDRALERRLTEAEQALNRLDLN